MTVIELDELGRPDELPLTPGEGRLLAASEVVTANTETFSNLVDSTMDGYQFVDGLDVETPNLLNGVVSCPNGTALRTASQNPGPAICC